MALHLHRAERTDLLADGLGALLSNPLPDSLLSVNGFGGWEPHTIGVNCAKGYVFQPDCRTRGVHAGQAGEPMT